ncbi:hypothetical protein DV737_g2651, partial [Chaetothyriales sp. CBS 132003]
MLAFEQSQRDQIFKHLNSSVQAPYPGLDMETLYGTYESMSSFSHHLPFSYYESQSMIATAPAQSSTPQRARTHSAQSLPFSHPAEMPPALISTASNPSIPSASSSTVGSPYSGPVHMPTHDEYNAAMSHSIGAMPTIVNQDAFDFSSSGFEPELPIGHDKLNGNFVADPSLINGTIYPNTMTTAVIPSETVMHGTLQQPDASMYHHPFSAMSPVNSPAPSPNLYQQTQFSPPVTYANYDQHSQFESRQHSVSGSFHSSHASPASEFEDGEKGRCPHPGCGRVFKDLKAHMLTHQAQRPEKCPILTCEYNQKGFARKYDKNRHTLTHYKGTMVCGFCPGSGSAAEKSFNRADVFKRHLTAVHGVEQTPPNSRKRSPPSTKVLTSYCQDATGKCSTCSATFSNAQDFYEHLDDCVLRVVQQEEPSMIKSGKAPASAKAVIGGGIQKSKAGKKGMTWSKGGVTLVGKGRKKRKHYPPSWGMSAEKMQMKKRVLCVYDGERRLWKDDMMLHNQFEVRMKLPDGKSYVTDLDVETIKRADAFHNASEAEKGPWITDDMSPEGVPAALGGSSGGSQAPHPRHWAGTWVPEGIVDLPKFDLQQYISNYRGRTVFRRLYLIASCSVALREEAAKLAVLEARKGSDVNNFKAAVALLASIPNYHDTNGLLNSSWAVAQGKKNASETSRLENELKGYKNNLIKESIRMGNEDLGNHYYKIGDLAPAAKAYARMRDYCTTPLHIASTAFRSIAINIEMKNWLGVQSQINKVRSLQMKPEESARIQPKANAAMGLQQMCSGEYRGAAISFLSTDPSLGDSYNEFLTSNDVAVYGGLCALASMTRSELQARVLESQSFRNFLELEPHIRRAISFFYASKYRQCLEILESYRADYLLDLYLQPHVSEIYQRVRTKAIVQYFAAFSKVTLASMESTFAIQSTANGPASSGNGSSDTATSSQAFRDELIGLIQSGQLDARIDLESNTLIAKTIDQRADMQKTALETVDRFIQDAHLKLIRLNVLNAGLEFGRSAAGACIWKSAEERSMTGR